MYLVAPVVVFQYDYTMKKISILFCSLLSIFIISCNTTKEIPQDLSAPQLLQKGQSSLDAADYKMAEAYFLETINRFGDDTDTYIEAKYELAHLHIKIKHYDKAYAELEEILELYSYAAAGTLPAAYKKLAEIEMSKIPPAKLEELQASSHPEE